MAEKNTEINKNFLLGIYNDEDVVLNAVKVVREKGVKIHEVFTPYPIHGLEHVLGYKKSYMPRAAFMFGALGTTLAIIMQTSMMGIDWPMIIGGKSYIAIPNFVPVTFESTVLLSAFGMVGTFLVSQDMKPYKVPRIFDRRSTDDKMVMAIDLAANKLSEQEIREVLIESGVEKESDGSGNDVYAIRQRNFTEEENNTNFFKYLAGVFANGVKDSSRPITQ